MPDPFSLEPGDQLTPRQRFVKKWLSPELNRKPKTVMTDARGRRLKKRRMFEVKIREAALSRRVITIVYKKVTTREIKEYIVEPYSYRIRQLRIGRRKMLFAYDVKDKTIKNFAMVNLRRIDIGAKKYRARWKVEF